MEGVLDVLGRLIGLLETLEASGRVKSRKNVKSPVGRSYSAMLALLHTEAIRISKSTS